MTWYFSLENPFNKLYAEIGETIKQYYPIGLTPESPKYNKYPGIKKITAFRDENSTRNKKFNKPWKDFLRKLRIGSKRKIHNYSFLTDVSFSGELILERYDDEALMR